MLKRQYRKISHRSSSSSKSKEVAVQRLNLSPLCPDCGRANRLTVSNSTLIEVVTNTTCACIQIDCAHCHETYWVFPLEHELQLARNLHWPYAVLVEPTPVMLFASQSYRPPPLTQPQEQLVDDFATQMNGCSDLLGQLQSD
jgi:hypothetical protein